MNQKSKALLEKLDLDSMGVIQDGMESIILEAKPDTILKVSKKKGQTQTLLRRQRFYDSLTWDSDSPLLPKIIRIEERKGHTLTYEKKLPGTSVDSRRLSVLKVSEMKRFCQNYLDVLFNIRNIQTDFLEKADPLDKSGFFIKVPDYDWNAMLKESIETKYKKLNKCITRDLTDHTNKMQTITSSLAHPYQGRYELIHGDFYPANLLVNRSLEITAVIDFGVLTTKGDRVFDLATGWTFFDMYRQIKKSFDHMEYLADLIFEGISGEEKVSFYKYLLVYSIISLDMYYSECTDDHYQWCMRNLNDEELWKKAF